MAHIFVLTRAGVILNFFRFYLSSVQGTKSTFCSSTLRAPLNTIAPKKGPTDPKFRET